MTIIKKFDPVEQKKKFPKKIIILGAVSLFILTVVEIWVSNTVAAYGDKFETLTKLEKNLNLENQQIENQIAQNASLVNISSKSAQLGFSDNPSIQYIR